VGFHVPKTRMEKNHLTKFFLVKVKNKKAVNFSGILQKKNYSGISRLLEQ
jgi:hypothetical protein